MWGTVLNNVYLSRISAQGAESEQESEELLIQMFRDELMVLAASTPRDVKDDEGYTDRWEDYVRRRVSEIVEGLRESIIKSYQLSLIINSAPADIKSE